MPIFSSFAQANLDQYDVIIAGSGHAAVSLAHRLADRGRDVLMLESGGLEYDDQVQAQFTRMFGRGHFDGSYWPQHWIRSLGGTSAVWSGWCAPLSQRNLADWPIDLSDLEKYYQDAATFLRRDHAFLNYTSPFIDGFNYVPFSLGENRRLAQEVDSVYENRARLDIALNSTLSELTPRNDRRGITSINVVGADGTTIRSEIKENQVVVLAAGGMGNAQILLSSDQGENTAVGNENDQVGRYLMEHPHLYQCGRVVLQGQTNLPDFPGAFEDYIPALVPDEGVFAATGGLDVSIELSESRLNAADPSENYLARKFGINPKIFNLNIRGEMPAEKANRVTVTSERNADGLRILNANFVMSADAFRAADICLEHLGNSLIQTNRGRLRIINDNLYHAPQGGGHTMGTTRMGADPRNSVVNANCRVHGYRNLFVAGSSVFASGGYANPTLTIIALAKRLADYLGDGV